MTKRNRFYSGIMLAVLALLGINVAAKTFTQNNNPGSKLAGLHLDSLLAVNLQTVINHSGVVFNQNQTVRLVHALNKGIILPDPNPDQIISLEITLSLNNGNQITIGDSGNAEFLVTINADSSSECFIWCLSWSYG